MFLLNSKNKADNKNWISQGLTADKAIVIANLVIDNKKYGAHGFLVMNYKENGKISKGIEVGDMGRKICANHLDTAWISF